MLDRKRLQNSTPPVRQWLLLGLLAIQAIVVAVMAMIARSNTTTLQLDNAKTVMTHVSENVLKRTQQFLLPAEHTAQVAQGMLSSNVLQPFSEPFQTLMLEQLQAVPQLTGMYFGSVLGEFIFAYRTATGFRVKEIRIQPTRRVNFKNHNQSLKLISREVVASDNFEPRSRPWYKQALEQNRLVWTNPYMFFTAQKPGITAAIPVTREGGQTIGVVGVDIEIAVLSKFIEQIPTSPFGTAFITTNKGEVVGMSQLEQRLPKNSRDLPKLSDVGSKSALALQALSNSQAGLQQYQIDNIGWVGLTLPLLVNQDATWSLGIHAPRSDFVGATEKIFNHQLWQTLLTHLLVFVIAIPLIWTISAPIETWYRRATTDELTQLLNRTEFLVRAKKTLRQTNQSGVMVMFDLDRFKNINDVFGHDAGDKVLKSIAQRLRERVRANDVVARFGGDEFAIFLPNISLKTAQDRLETWRNEIIEPFKRFLSVSVGIAGIHPSDDIESKIIEADQALLAAKNSGKNRIIST